MGWGVAILLFAVGVAFTATAQAASAPSGTPVLMYHKVDPVTPPDPVGRSLTIEPSAFEAQLAWLRDHHIQTITTSELVDDLAHGRPPQNSVVLTFDDGYTDGATVVTPLLEKYHDRATFYVSAGFVGDGRHMTWRQLRAMHAAGMEIACHGTFHRDLTTIGTTAANFEVNHCEQALTRYVVHPVTYAYAAGRHDAAIEQIVKDAGFEVALTESPGIVTSLNRPYDLPRRRVDRSAGLASFAALATP